MMERYISTVAALIVVLSVSNCTSSPIQKTIVTTQDGPVKGSLQYSLLGTQYSAFRGIPYAAPPIGSRRLLPPIQPDPWEEVLDVSSDNEVMCPQVLGPLGDEDCLLLFVYSPLLAPPANSSGLPVMVWLHGGAFLLGSGTSRMYGPGRIMDHRVVLVSVNYRLGSLGYFSLGTEELNGNQGMLDQVMALKWVQENIAAFGGDPNLVTLWGESAGSYSLFFHLMSPLSTGLFHRAIGQSGHPLSRDFHEYSAETALEMGRTTTANVGCGIEGIDTLKCLQEAPMSSLLLGLHSMPAVDANYSANPFLPTSSYEAYTSGWYNKEVQILMGTNKDEGLTLTLPVHIVPSLIKKWQETWNTTGPRLLFGRSPDDVTQEDLDDLALITDFYLGSLDNLDEDHVQDLTDMISDSSMFSGVHQFIRQHTSQGGSLYHYIYSYQGEHSLTNSVFHAGGPYGVCHTDELFLLFDSAFLNPVLLNAEDSQVSEKLLKLWTNFAKFGDPTPATEDMAFVWNFVDGTNKNYLNITSQPEMEYSVEYQSRMEFWDQLIS